MQKSLFTALILLVSLFASAQVRTNIHNENIRSLRVKYEESTNLSRPFLVLDMSEPYHTNATLQISFDELSHEKHNYQYTVVHCNADWQPSSLMTSEYLNGFFNDDIDDYDYSVATQQNYTHYFFTFPNDDMQPKVSGNYLIQIYEDNDINNLIGEVGFCIVEPETEIKVDIRGNTDVEYNGKYQQLDIETTINHPNSGRNLAEDYFIVVQQNNRTDNLVYAPRPSFVNYNQLIFKNNKSLIFEGGMEYRHFDISSVYFKGNNVDRIDFDHNYYHAFLFPDENRANQTYLSDYDTNGQFVINAERSSDVDYEADYMYVHFLLPAKQQWLDGNIYLMGDAFENKLDASNRMTYDEEHQCYVYSTYLKQGAYDYQYTFYNTRKPQNFVPGATTTRVEGSHWETNNDYVVYVYNRPFGARYDRLVGLAFGG